ncbi:MAG: hypothetical protein WEB87_06730, partial [Bacteriovoracaceae bacterium]
LSQNSESENEGGQEINFEAKELSEALDAAFDNLMGNQDFGEEESAIQDESETQEEAALEAGELNIPSPEDLDLDLDFLKDSE